MWKNLFIAKFYIVAVHKVLIKQVYFSNIKPYYKAHSQRLLLLVTFVQDEVTVLHVHQLDVVDATLLNSFFSL